MMNLRIMLYTYWTLLRDTVGKAIGANVALTIRISY